MKKRQPPPIKELDLDDIHPEVIKELEMLSPTTRMKVLISSRDAIWDIIPKHIEGRLFDIYAKTPLSPRMMALRNVGPGGIPYQEAASSYDGWIKRHLLEMLS